MSNWPIGSLPFFKAGTAHFKERGQDSAAIIRSLVQYLADSGMDREAIERMAPYLKRFMDDVQSGQLEID